ncbi:hypothetical protein GWI33_002737, partial [Rhynchophorus ferrugineus]
THQQPPPANANRSKCRPLSARHLLAGFDYSGPSANSLTPKLSEPDESHNRNRLSRSCRLSLGRRSPAAWHKKGPHQIFIYHKSQPASRFASSATFSDGNRLLSSNISWPRTSPSPTPTSHRSLYHPLY